MIRLEFNSRIVEIMRFGAFLLIFTFCLARIISAEIHSVNVIKGALRVSIERGW